jgi:N-acetylglucosaminyldiphosphoundecaprenol N-acetyl-beta-D-mannosaminyltransferase
MAHNVKFYIVTPNPELILMARKDKKLKEALNGADISVPDGVGLKIADPKLKIIKGRELFLELIKLAAKNRWKVFLLGGLGDEAEVAARKLQIINSNLQIEYSKGPKLNSGARPLTGQEAELERKAIEKINKFKPQLLFVAFGNPRQEIWVHDNLSKLNIGGAMCVGGTLRYLAGLSRLPPKFISKLGLEWLWRLVTEPERVGRVFRAVVVFPINLFISKISNGRNKDK